MENIDVAAAIEHIKAAQLLNAKLQELNAVGTNDWHCHETIDDRLHDALTKLGD